MYEILVLDGRKYNNLKQKELQANKLILLEKHQG